MEEAIFSRARGSTRLKRRGEECREISGVFLGGQVQKIESLSNSSVEEGELCRG